MHFSFATFSETWYAAVVKLRLSDWSGFCLYYIVSPLGPHRIGYSSLHKKHKNGPVSITHVSASESKTCISTSALWPYYNALVSKWEACHNVLVSEWEARHNVLVSECHNVLVSEWEACHNVLVSEWEACHNVLVSEWEACHNVLVSGREACHNACDGVGMGSMPQCVGVRMELVTMCWCGNGKHATMY